MASYKVVFETSDIEAENPMDAAQSVWDDLKWGIYDPQFYVQDEETGKLYSVDFAELKDDEGDEKSYVDVVVEVDINEYQPQIKKL